MHIISKKKIVEFSYIHPDSRNSLFEWYSIVKNMVFMNHAELKAIFPGIDLVGRRTVFNISGNKYRLIARVNFHYKKIFILYILTHAEYDKVKWKE